MIVSLTAARLPTMHDALEFGASGGPQPARRRQTNGRTKRGIKCAISVKGAIFRFDPSRPPAAPRRRAKEDAVTKFKRRKGEPGRRRNRADKRCAGAAFTDTKCIPSHSLLVNKPCCSSAKHLHVQSLCRSPSSHSQASVYEKKSSQMSSYAYKT